jgi:hypothetical protein
MAVANGVLQVASSSGLRRYAWRLSFSARSRLSGESSTVTITFGSRRSA